MLINQRLGSTYRRLRPVLAGAVLLQMGGCTLDVNALLAGVLTSIAEVLISDFVFGAFNLATF